MADHRPGDIVLLDLDPTRGREQRKTRPCLVVSDTNPLGLVIVVPVTDAGTKKSRLFVPIAHTPESGLSKPSVVDVFQVRCVDPERVVKKLGEAPDETMDGVRTALAFVFRIQQRHLI